MDEFMVHYSHICNCWWVMRIPAWAIERAGEAGEWTTDDGDTYTPFDMNTIEGDRAFETKREAEDFMRTLTGG